MTPEPQPSQPARRPLTAVGAAEPFPVVLVETSGALGVLFAQRRCPDERLEEVLYFRSLMGEPYARFLDAVELVTIEGFSVARAVADGGIFYEPSRVAYEIKNIPPGQYGQFVDHIVGHDLPWVEREVAKLFQDCPGFSLTSEGKLIAPAGYANGLEQFVGSYPFVDPLGKKSPGTH